MAPSSSKKVRLRDLQAACRSANLSDFGTRKELTKRLGDRRMSQQFLDRDLNQTNEADAEVDIKAEHNTTTIEDTLDQQSLPFDRNRFAVDFHDLQSPPDCVSFLALIKEYTDYIRRGGLVGDENFVKFIRMIDNETGWGLARQVVKEFRQALPDISINPTSLQTLLEKISHRLPLKVPVDPRRTVIRDHELKLNWRRLQSLTNCLAPNRDEESLAEADQIARQIATALKEDAVDD